MYNLSMRKIFEKAGFYRTKVDAESLKIEQADVENSNSTTTSTKKISSLKTSSNMQTQLEECMRV